MIKRPQISPNCVNDMWSLSRIILPVFKQFCLRILPVDCFTRIRIICWIILDWSTIKEWEGACVDYEDKFHPQDGRSKPYRFIPNWPYKFSWKLKWIQGFGQGNLIFPALSPIFSILQFIFLQHLLLLRHQDIIPFFGSTKRIKLKHLLCWLYWYMINYNMLG